MTLFTLGSLSAGRIEVARAFESLAEKIREEQGERDLVFAGWLRLVRDAMAFYHRDDPATAYREVKEGVALLDAAMDPVGLSLARVYEGTVVLETGDALGADAIFTEANRLATLSGVRYSRVISRVYLARVRVSLGRPKEALTMLEETFDERDMFLSSLARAGASEAFLALGERGEARRSAELCLAAPATISLPQTLACSVLARLALAASEIDETLTHVERGMTIARTAAFPRCRSELTMARAEALSRSRQHAEARAAQAEAKARVERIAADLARAGLHHVAGRVAQAPREPTRADGSLKERDLP